LIEYSKLKAILFDVDETLVSTSVIHEEAFIRTLKEFEINCVFDYSTFSGMRTKQVFESLAISPELIEDMTGRKQAYTWELLSEVKEKPGASETLRHLKDKTIEIYTISSGSKRNVQRSLELTGLSQFITASISAEDVLRGKPDPECYLLAIQEFRLNRENVVAIEDSVAGCESARQAKIEVIGISNLEKLDCSIQYTSMVDLLVELQKQ
jgi:beta-phosphoglucomutase